MRVVQVSTRPVRHESVRKAMVCPPFRPPIYNAFRADRRGCFAMRTQIQSKSAGAVARLHALFRSTRMNIPKKGRRTTMGSAQGLERTLSPFDDFIQQKGGYVCDGTDP